MKPELLMIPFAILTLSGIYWSNLIIVGIGFMLLLMMFAFKRISSDKEIESTALKAITIFSQKEISNYHIGSDNLTCIGLDDKKDEIVFLSREDIKQDFKVVSIPFSEIFEVKLNEDDKTVTSVSRASQLGGAIAGGLIGGSIGAIVGGSSGTQHSEKEIRKIELEIVVNDFISPIRTVSFLNEDLFIKSYEPKYKNQYEIANKWYMSISVILKRNERKLNSKLV